MPLTPSERRKVCSTNTCLSSASDPVAAKQKHDRVNNFCGRWLRLSICRSFWVHFDQKRTVVTTDNVIIAR